MDKKIKIILWVVFVLGVGLFALWVGSWTGLWAESLGAWGAGVFGIGAVGLTGGATRVERQRIKEHAVMVDRGTELETEHRETEQRLEQRSSELKRDRAVVDARSADVNSQLRSALQRARENQD